MDVPGRDERARSRAAARRALFGGADTLPMTPVRPPPEELDTPALIAEAADEHLLGKNLSVLSSVHSVQSTQSRQEMDAEWT
jgi:hypothetical protein